MLNLVVSAKI